MGHIVLKDKKVLVTGGCGFLGSHLVKRLLQEKAQVSVIDLKEGDHEEVTYYKVPLNAVNQLRDIIADVAPEVIFHLAADLNRRRDFNLAPELLDTNLRGTVHLLNALKSISYERFVFVSTSEVYGGNHLKAPFKETDPVHPASPYSLSKYAAEVALRTYSEMEQKPFTILRLFNFFGPGLADHFFMSQLISALRRAAPFDMTGGEQKRDFLFVDDVIEALIAALGAPAKNDLFNVCSGQGHELKTMALTLRELLQSSSVINFGALPYRPNEIWNMVGDRQKIKAVLNWEPKYSLREGLQHLLEDLPAQPNL